MKFLNKFHKLDFLATTLAFFATLSAHAVLDCTDKAAMVKSTHRLPGEGYWLQPVDEKRITYTSHGGTDSKMFNIVNNQPESITNQYDAFAIPPGDLYVHPNDGFSFYKIGDGSQANPIFQDPEDFGVYQSLGLLPETTGPDFRVVRIAAGWGAGIFQDYKIRKNLNGTYDFQKVHAGPTPMCRNLPSGGLDSQIPILSRNGMMIAGRDLDDQTTKIYKISMTVGQPASSCQILQTIPTETSKITFSFDNKKVLFVISDPNTAKGRLMEMTIDTAKMKTLSLPNEDVMYMSYRYDQTLRNDNAVLYTRRVGASFADVPSDLIVMSPHAVADNGGPNALTLEALGFLWGHACGVEIDIDYARSVGSRIKKSMCNDIVQTSHITSLPEEYHSISREQLLALCNTDDRVESLGIGAH